jgi:hypothetical protein
MPTIRWKSRPTRPFAAGRAVMGVAIALLVAPVSIAQKTTGEPTEIISLDILHPPRRAPMIRPLKQIEAAREAAAETRGSTVRR